MSGCQTATFNQDKEELEEGNWTCMNARNRPVLPVDLIYDGRATIEAWFQGSGCKRVLVWGGGRGAEGGVCVLG